MREKTQLDLELFPKITSLQELAKAENECRRCPLYKNATQAVPGEGRKSARVMLVGEQPGDKEDLAGRPFVGPAGRVLDRALADAGIPRTEVFVTNAVKHFKHEMRGKRRLHKRPNAYEIERCKIWLDLEGAIVKPLAIVALGATGGAQSVRSPRHHRQGAWAHLASRRRYRRFRHHPSVVAAAHRGRGGQGTRV
jgi:DNA polymerase